MTLLGDIDPEAMIGNALMLRLVRITLVTINLREEEQMLGQTQVHNRDIIASTDRRIYQIMIRQQDP